MEVGCRASHGLSKPALRIVACQNLFGGQWRDSIRETDAAVMGGARTDEPRLPSAFHLDAFFRVVDSVYVGPEDGMSPKQWETARVALSPPDLSLRMPGRVATTELLGHEEALSRHYRRLIRVAEAYGKTAVLARPFPYFAVGPSLLADGSVLAAWPWNDTLPEAVSVLEALSHAGTAAPGAAILDDADQGWAIRAVAEGGSVLIAEWDGEGPAPAGATWRLDATILAEQAATALERLRTVHARLARQLGRDLWS